MKNDEIEKIKTLKDVPLNFQDIQTRTITFSNAHKQVESELHQTSKYFLKIASKPLSKIFSTQPLRYE